MMSSEIIFDICLPPKLRLALSGLGAAEKCLLIHSTLLTGVFPESVAKRLKEKEASDLKSVPDIGADRYDKVVTVFKSRSKLK